MGTNLPAKHRGEDRHKEDYRGDAMPGIVIQLSQRWLAIKSTEQGFDTGALSRIEVDTIPDSLDFVRLDAGEFREREQLRLPIGHL